MIKLEYPKGKFQDEYRSIINEYYAHENRLKNIKIQFHKLFGKNYNVCYLDRYKFLETLILPFEELLQISKKFKDEFMYELKGHYYFNFKYTRKQIKNGKQFNKRELQRYNKKLESLRNLFPYSILQKKISKLFRKYNDELKLGTCYYCNIDYVTSYNDFGDYRDILDFFNYAKKEELLLMPKITDKNVNYIQKTTFDTEDEIIKNVHGIADLSTLKEKLYQHTHDHFTLDHFIDKGTYPILSLCLFNFIPSCYSCNSKLKKDKNLIENKSAKISPTSPLFAFDTYVKFKIYMINKTNSRYEVNKHSNIVNIKKENDFIIELVEKDNFYTEYIDCFKLKGRYKFHKQEALKLINNKKKYPDKYITAMARAVSLKKNPAEINNLANILKKNIFGKEVFDGEVNEVPFTKFKRDIAKNIGIL